MDVSSKREDSSVYWGIEDNALSEGINLEWGCGNNFLVYAVKHKALSDHEGELHPYKPVLHDIRWNTSLFNPVTRKLVNESHGIFLSLQAATQHDNECAKKQIMIKVSKKYRSVLTECVFNLQKLLESETLTEEETDEYAIQLEMFFNIELIWNLCEILIIDIVQPGLVLQQLLQWILFHFPQSEYRDSEEKLFEYEKPESHESYWDIVYFYVLHGRVKEARKILNIHSLSSHDSFRIMDAVLGRMPLYKSSSSQSIVEVGIHWRQWQEECKRRLFNEEFSTIPELQILCKILCGDKETFENFQHICGNWYSMMVSRLFYSDPRLIVNSLADVGKECIALYNKTGNMSLVDSILLAVIEFDLGQVIRESCNFDDNWWFVTHFTDILYHCDLLEQVSYAGRLREFHLLDYASSLMSHHSLWQVGIDYYDHCSEMGQQHLELYLERIPLTSDEKAAKVLAIALKRDMHLLANSICKTMGMQAMMNKQLGTALRWAVQSKDVNFVSYLANQFLAEYVNNGKFTSLELLDNLGTSMLISDKLAFLGKYREFHKLYEEKDYPSAASLIVSLLSSKLAPKQFWITLLLDALPLLESVEINFSSQQIYELLYYMEELTGSPESDKLSEMKDKEDLIRFALARSLARTLIKEGSSPSE